MFFLQHDLVNSLTVGQHSGKVLAILLFVGSQVQISGKINLINVIRTEAPRSVTVGNWNFNLEQQMVLRC